MEEKEKKTVEKKKETPKETKPKKEVETKAKTATEPKKEVKAENKVEPKNVETKKSEPKKDEFKKVDVKKEMPKTEPVKKESDKKTGIIVAVVALILIVCLILGVVAYVNRDETKVLALPSTVSVSVSYPASKGFSFEEDNKVATIKKNDGDFLIKVQIDTESIEYWYSGDFSKYKDGKQGKDITINGVTGFSYYYKDAQRYTIVLPVNEKTTISIDIEPTQKSESNPTGEEIFNREDIQKIVNSIKLENV